MMKCKDCKWLKNENSIFSWCSNIKAPVLNINVGPLSNICKEVSFKDEYLEQVKKLRSERLTSKSFEHLYYPLTPEESFQ